MKILGILILGQLICSQAFAWRESNGGNGISAEAKSIANKLISDMWKIPSVRVYYQLKDYDVIPQKNLYLKKEKVDAYTLVNTEAEKTLIFIDEDKWNARDYTQKRFLMLHELTHFMFHKDESYMFSDLVITKLERYKKLEQKYPDSDYPIEDEIVSSLQECRLTNFVVSYLLVGSIDYELEGQGKTVYRLINESKCDNIKLYGPLQSALHSKK